VEQPLRRREGHIERVRSGDAIFYVEVVDGGGAGPVGATDALSLDGVRDTVEAIAAEFTEVWNRVKPTEASIEFGLALTAKSGKLTGLLVEGSGSASLKVTMAWKPPKPE
jgi:hypothetical protein